MTFSEYDGTADKKEIIIAFTPLPLAGVCSAPACAEFGFRVTALGGGESGSESSAGGKSGRDQRQC